MKKSRQAGISDNAGESIRVNLRQEENSHKVNHEVQSRTRTTGLRTNGQHSG